MPREGLRQASLFDHLCAGNEVLWQGKIDCSSGLEIAHVRFGSKADIEARPFDVRFTPECVAKRG